ncbi:hypothetical protein JG688_00017587, partial [Phytophthora aleatoria]
KKTYDPELLSFVGCYVKEHPCFYIEELQAELRARFGTGPAGLSASSILRLSKFNLGLSRKVIERRAREAVPRTIEALVAKMRSWYSYPAQFLFVDETSTNGLDCVRRYAWAKRGERAIVRTPFACGERVSILFQKLYFNNY